MSEATNGPAETISKCWSTSEHHNMRLKESNLISSAPDFSSGGTVQRQKGKTQY